ncbi:hypothetical protein PUN28_001671 [Cardiocondyla obscurior]|uniref:Uncharacterized protein n=1 Tax=Cardiocondyla obscurior TaxID=286306 RepID=A0AAW2GQP6_9HYME
MPRCLGGKLKLRSTLSSLKTSMRRSAFTRGGGGGRRRERGRRKRRWETEERRQYREIETSRGEMEATRRKRLSWRCGGGAGEDARRREEARKERIRGGGLETTERPARRQSASEREKKGDTRKGRRGKKRRVRGKRGGGARERERERERENRRRERPAEPTSTRTNCFTGKSFAVLISRCDPSRNRAWYGGENECEEISESPSEFPSHREPGSKICGACRCSGRENVSRVPRMGWDSQSDVTSGTRERRFNRSGRASEFLTF